MPKLAASQLSILRQKHRFLTEKISKLSSRVLFADPLIHGTPNRVFRKCGKATCKCASDPSGRHGPYKVIHIVENGKQRQVALRKDQEEIWQLAVHYQHQKEKLSELKDVLDELVKFYEQVIELRLEKFP